MASDLPPFDLRRPEFTEDPYPIFRAYRESAPVSRGVDGTWYLFRHADVAEFLTRDDFLRAPSSAPSRPPVPEDQRAFYAMLSRVLAFRDPPDHTRLRALLQRSFAPRAVERLRPKIEELSDRLLDRVFEADRIDFIADYSYPLPLVVIAELLGVPVDRRDELRDWADAITRGIDLHTTADEMVRADRATRAITEALREWIEARRRSPLPDLLTELVHAEEEGVRLDEDELVANCIFLLLAGHETTAHALANGMIAFLEHPEAWALLEREPERIPEAVEEILRYDSPVQFTIRIAADEARLGGARIAAGERVCALLGAANRDPAAFPDPDRFDVRRPARSHLGFGRGIHFCLGASLARLEMAVALERLLLRRPEFHLDSPRLERPPHVALRRVKALPLRIRSRR